MFGIKSYPHRYDYSRPPVDKKVLPANRKGLAVLATPEIQLDYNFLLDFLPVSSLYINLVIGNFKEIGDGYVDDGKCKTDGENNGPQ